MFRDSNPNPNQYYIVAVLFWQLFREYFMYTGFTYHKGL